MPRSLGQHGASLFESEDIVYSLKKFRAEWRSSIENWKSVKGLEGRYSVSDKGNVKSLSRVAGNVTLKDKILKPREHTAGYLIVSIGLISKYSNKYIHRLVAQAFIPNPKNLPEVNHIDEDKQNNMVENLEWCTSKQNMTHNEISFRKWKGRRTMYKSTDLKTGEVKMHENTESYKLMEKDGFTKSQRCRVNKMGKTKTKSGKLLEILN